MNRNFNKTLDRMRELGYQCIRAHRVICSKGDHWKEMEIEFWAGNPGDGARLYLLQTCYGDDGSVDHWDLFEQVDTTNRMDSLLAKLEAVTGVKRVKEKRNE